MKKRKRLKEIMFEKMAENMVRTVDTPPYIAEIKKDLKDAKVTFITTAGVHLKKDQPFNTKGDHTFRVIPRDVNYEDLTITHDHYDKKEVLKDINCVFPLQILRHFAEGKIIGSVAPRNFGLMGYVPEVDLLINESAPAIADKLVEDKVDIALLSPG